MNTEYLDKLFADYVNETGTNIEREYFDVLLLYFPCLMVAASDGVVDDEEWVYVRYLAKFMTERHQDKLTHKEFEVLRETFYRELQYLVTNLDTWKDKFIASLKDYLSDYEWMKDDMEEILEVFADASDGISQEEEEMMDFLRKELELDV